MSWLLVLCAFIAASADATSSSRLKLLDQPVSKLPQSARPNTFTIGAWHKLEPVSSAIQKVSPHYSLQTPIQMLMTDTFFRELRSSRLQTRFLYDMLHSRLPFNLTQSELEFFKYHPNHSLFDSVYDLPIDGTKGDLLKGRLVTKGIIFVIDIVKGFLQPPPEKRLFSYRVGQTNVQMLADAVTKHLISVSSDPLCQEFFDQDMI